MNLPQYLLGNVTFKKSGAELHKKLGLRIVETVKKIAARKKRITDLRAAHEITDKDMIELLQQQQSNSRAQFYNLEASTVLLDAPAGSTRGKKMQAAPTSRAIPAGVVANLAQEADLIRKEEAAVASWKVTHRNLDQRVQHTVSLEDLTFLGF